MGNIEAALENDRRSEEFLFLTLTDINPYMKKDVSWPDEGMKQYLSNYKREVLQTVTPRSGEDEVKTIRHALNKLFYRLVDDDLIDPEKIKNSEIYQKVQRMPALMEMINKTG